MSRAQQGQVLATASGENKAYNNEAQTSYGAAQQDISNYSDAVGAFKAQNPYVQGGQFQTAANQGIADTAAAGAQRAGQALQSQAVRTGQNAGGAIAATEDMQAQNQRAQAGEQAAATQARLAGQTGYGEAVVGDTAQIGTMQERLAGQESGAAQGALGTEEQAANTPSFMDELGQGLITSGEQFAAAYGKAKGGK